MSKQNILDIPLAEFPKVIKGLGLKSFAASQIIQWIYKKGASSFEEMTNLSKEGRKLLSENFNFDRLKVVKTLESVDGTKKFAFELQDGNIIESVLIPSEEYAKADRFGEPVKVPKEEWRTRLTLCISTQVGCAMGCTFCRTGELGFVRNLTQGEIIGQILTATSPVIASEARQSHDRTRGIASGTRPRNDAQRISNVVLMGMGEPLANYDNVIGSIKIMLDTKCLGLSKRHVTLSTCGLIPEIEKLSKEDLGVKLAISLNATTDEAREKVMPINKNYPLAKLFAALKKYSLATKKKLITFEYVMIGGFNDSPEDAKRLVRLLSHFPSKVNLIPLNSVCHCEPLPAGRQAKGRGNPPKKVANVGLLRSARNDVEFAPPTNDSIQRFAKHLREKRIQVNIRSSRGQDILAACGQLAGRKKPNL